MKRRLILLLDGTWNEDGDFSFDSNIVLLRKFIARALEGPASFVTSIDDVNDRDDPSLQIGARRRQDIDYFVFYERGVGTGPGLDRILGGALGQGLEQNIRRAYKFLSRYYNADSEIFIFGFSRGAYTARSLVGFLGSSGLLKKEHCTQELEAKVWSYYRTTPNDRFPGIFHELKNYVHDISSLRISCLGVFDTVGALGVPLTLFSRKNRQKYEFHDIELSPIVKVNLHALAIDECRPQFQASIWRKSKFRVNNSIVEQVWFPGAHADIGGGYISEEQRDRLDVRSLDEITLDWMIKRIKHYFSDFPLVNHGIISQSPGFAMQHNSRTLKYRMFGPALRVIGNRKLEAKQLREKIVSFDRDWSSIGEAVHISALERIGNAITIDNARNTHKYMPRNLLNVVPSLYERYCQGDSTVFNEQSLKFVSWSGNVLSPDSDAAEVESAFGILKRARAFV